MVIVLVHWKIKPEKKEVFLKHWREKLRIKNRSGLIAEHLCEAAEVGIPCWVNWDLEPKTRKNKFKSYVNVGLWADEDSFLREIKPNCNEDEPPEEFEAYRRQRVVLRNPCIRMGKASHPGKNSKGVL